MRAWLTHYSATHCQLPLHPLSTAKRLTPICRGAGRLIYIIGIPPWKVRPVIASTPLRLAADPLISRGLSAREGSADDLFTDRQSRRNG